MTITISINLDPELKPLIQDHLDRSPDTLDDIINRALRQYFAPSSTFPIPTQCAIAIIELLWMMHQELPRHHHQIQDTLSWLEEWMAPEPGYRLAELLED